MSRVLSIVFPGGTVWARCESGDSRARDAVDQLGVGATLVTDDGRVIYECTEPVPYARRQFRRTPGGFLYRQHPHLLCGNDSDRQSVGEPGHCEDCAAVGHMIAHPELGCGDVRCYLSHDDDGNLLSPHGSPTPGPVKPPRLKRDWAGRRVRTLRPLSNRVVVIPVGVELTVSRNHNGLHLTSDPCKCCGVQVFMNRVPESDVELLPE